MCVSCNIRLAAGESINKGRQLDIHVTISALSYVIIYYYFISGFVYVLVTRDSIPKEVLLLLFFRLVIVSHFVQYKHTRRAMCDTRDAHPWIMYLPGLDFLCGNQEAETKGSEVLSTAVMLCSAFPFLQIS